METEIYLQTLEESIEVMLVIEYSKIGYSYPKIYLEMVPNHDYVIFDLELNSTFKLDPDIYKSCRIEAKNIDDILTIIPGRLTKDWKINFINSIKEERRLFESSNNNKIMDSF